MALSQKHRSTIYQRLEPILGEEEAEALLSQFPTHELDEPATKELVRAEISALRVEMHQLVNRLFVSLVGVMVGVAGFALAVARIS
jgi:hypothetical protein